MEAKKSWAVRTFLISFICNGILIAFLLISKSPLVTVVTGVVLTFILCLMLLSMARPVSQEVPAASEIRPVSEEALSPEPVFQMLGALQREGRLIDFLQEDLSQYEDGQIGAAVRSIHSGCKEVLKEHMEIKPIFEEKEGSAVTIPSGFDARAIRLTGNVTGNPPFPGYSAIGGGRWNVSVFRNQQSRTVTGSWLPPKLRSSDGKEEAY